jgi:hypothetical protein
MDLCVVHCDIRQQSIPFFLAHPPSFPFIRSKLGNNFAEIDESLLVQVIVIHALTRSFVRKGIRNDSKLFGMCCKFIEVDFLFGFCPFANPYVRCKVLARIFDPISRVVEQIVDLTIYDGDHIRDFCQISHR